MAEPDRYTVHDQPVVVVDGHARVLDLRTGAFVGDDHYLPLVHSGRVGVEPMAAGPFDRLVAALRRVAADDLRAARVVWDASGDSYRCEHEGAGYSVRAEGGDRYALVVNGQDVGRLEGWPPLWSRGVDLRAELRGLVELARVASPVTRDVVLAHLAPRSRATTTAGPDLTWPAWADRTSGADDVYVELGGEIAGARIPPPHMGQYVDLFAIGSELVDVEAVAGPLRSAVKVHYDDPDRHIGYLTVNGQALRVLVERRSGSETLVVSVHFPAAP